MVYLSRTSWLFADMDLIHILKAPERRPGGLTSHENVQQPGVFWSNIKPSICAPSANPHLIAIVFICQCPSPCLQCSIRQAVTDMDTKLPPPRMQEMHTTARSAA
jgi:hypothetical protein